MIKRRNWRAILIPCLLFAACQNNPERIDPLSAGDKVNSECADTSCAQADGEGVDSSRETSPNVLAGPAARGVIEAVIHTNVYSKLPLQVVEDHVSEGKAIKKGDLLYVLDDEDIREEMDRLRLDLDERELALREALIGQGFSWEDTASVPAKKMEYVKIKSGYTRAKLAYQQARRRLARTRITAPASGILTNVTLRASMMASTSQPCCVITDPQRLRVVFHMLETELGEMKVGQIVTVCAAALPQRTYKATITNIIPVVDENGLVKIKASLPDTHTRELMPGMNVMITRP